MSASAKRLIVAGGGAAGTFAALACAEVCPEAEVVLLEASDRPLQKVAISGGGRCNVTHACFDPRELVKSYPRGGRELLGPFHQWQPRDTVAWFEERGVPLKTESDGRVFPTSDRSSSVVDCLLKEADRLGVDLRRRAALADADKTPRGFRAVCRDGTSIEGDELILATGGGKSSDALAVAQKFGHTIAPLAPSLFTFKIKSPLLDGMAGVSVPEARVTLLDLRRDMAGPVLVTHWGLSGPAILRLSAFAARELADRAYRFDIQVAWDGASRLEQAAAALASKRQSTPRKLVRNLPCFGLPSRLWERLVASSHIPAATPWSQLSKAGLRSLAALVSQCPFHVDGKSANKEEFVTCGGVSLGEIDFRTMESRRHKGLRFAGEALDIDGLTGGFNLQAAWTTGRLAGLAAAARLRS